MKADMLTRREAALLRKDEKFLQDLRIHLHYLTGRREERLVFDVQTALAKQVGCRDTAHRRASEHLMQRFYRTAIEIGQLNTIVLQNLNALIAPPRSRATTPINEHFHSRNEMLEANDEGLFKRTPGAMLEAFIILQQRHELKGITAGTLRSLWRASASIDPEFRRDPANREEVVRTIVETTGSTEEIARLTLQLYFEPDRGVIPKQGEIDVKGFDQVVQTMGEVGELKSPLPSAERFYDLQYLKAAGLQ